MDNPIERIDVSAYTIPTDYPESDGTFEWNQTTIILVEAHAGGRTGIGYSYGDLIIGDLIRRVLAPVLLKVDAMSITAAHHSMTHVVRNIGRPGVASMAIGAVDSALWDLKAQLLDQSLVNLLGSARHGIPVYGSGGSLKKLELGCDINPAVISRYYPIVLFGISRRFHEFKNSIGDWIFPVDIHAFVWTEQPGLHTIRPIHR